MTGGAVGLPGGEDLFGHGGQVTDVHPAGVEVEPQGGGASVAQLQGGRALGDPGQTMGQHIAGADHRWVDLDALAHWHEGTLFEAS